MRIRSLLIVSAAALIGTSACSSGVRQALGAERATPDEFRVVTIAPLTVPPEVKQKMREALGLGEPPLVQYWKWLVQVFWIEPKVLIDWMTAETRLFGWLPDTNLYQDQLRVISWQTRSPVMEIIIQRIPQTLWVVGVAYIVAILIAITPFFFPIVMRVLGLVRPEQIRPTVDSLLGQSR